MFPRISRVSYECGACWYEEKRQRGVCEPRQSYGLTEDERHEKKKVAPWCFPEFLEFPTNAERADAKREDRGVCEPRQSHGLTEEERHEKKKVARQCFLEFLEFPTNTERADAKREDKEELVNGDNLMDLLKTIAMRRKK